MQRSYHLFQSLRHSSSRNISNKYCVICVIPPKCVSIKHLESDVLWHLGLSPKLLLAHGAVMNQGAGAFMFAPVTVSTSYVNVKLLFQQCED